MRGSVPSGDCYLRPLRPYAPEPRGKCLPIEVAVDLACFAAFPFEFSLSRCKCGFLRHGFTESAPRCVRFHPPQPAKGGQGAKIRVEHACKPGSGDRPEPGRGCRA